MAVTFIKVVLGESSGGGGGGLSNDQNYQPVGYSNYGGVCGSIVGSQGCISHGIHNDILESHYSSVFGDDNRCEYSSTVFIHGSGNFVDKSIHSVVLGKYCAILSVPDSMAIGHWARTYNPGQIAFASGDADSKFLGGNDTFPDEDFNHLASFYVLRSRPTDTNMLCESTDILNVRNAFYSIELSGVGYDDQGEIHEFSKWTYDPNNMQFNLISHEGYGHYFDPSGSFFNLVLAGSSQMAVVLGQGLWATVTLRLVEIFNHTGKK